MEESVTRARDVFGNLITLGNYASTLATVTNTTWPFVTLPGYEGWAGGTNLALSGARSISFGVLVGEDERNAWEAYSRENVRSWIEESLMYRPIVDLHEDHNHHGNNHGNHHRKDEDSRDYTLASENKDSHIHSNHGMHRALSYEHSNLQQSHGEAKVDSSSNHSMNVTDMLETSVRHRIWKYSDHMETQRTEDNVGDAAVIWQNTPLQPQKLNHNELRRKEFSDAYATMLNEKQAVMSDMMPIGHWSLLIQPVYDGVQMGEQKGSKIVGFFVAELQWDVFFEKMLPNGKSGIDVVVENTCGHSMTYTLDGPSVRILGGEDLHDSNYDRFEEAHKFDPFGSFWESSGCLYSIKIYPSYGFIKSYDTTKPALFAGLTALIICVIAGLFLFYDWSHRQKRLVDSAKKSHAIVSSLFPSNVRDRLLNEQKKTTKGGGGLGTMFRASQGALAATNADKESASVIIPPHVARPIADLFPATTVIFADIVGFTAWSSVREPSQVFTLLETIYDAFDNIAKRRGVFKVETIGDCYVAVTGLPNPTKDHALVMTNFARRCMQRMSGIVFELEVLLGPGTGDLGMRFGLHSGPVMAGVLRGEKSRFQLFGDTVNTASRIESSGAKNRIHISESTANELTSAGKSAWLRKREEKIKAKGKGALQTYWVEAGKILSDPGKTASVSSGSLPSITHLPERLAIEVADEANKRMVNYNVEVLSQFLKKLIAMRTPQQIRAGPQLIDKTSSTDSPVLSQVAEIIELPDKVAEYHMDPTVVTLSDVVVAQLKDFTTTIAMMYHSNSFHGFEHASHVTMSVAKLMSRLVTPETIDYNDMTYKVKGGNQKLHECSFGITSDPLTQFAVAFSALIHDVDHQGVPNSVLVEEGEDVAIQYNNQSVAEQNSVDLAWELLMEDRYADLRNCIYSTQEEHDRFRQLVVNAVLATDIMDKELGALRKRRWDMAFNQDSLMDSSPKEMSNRKATIVIEHLIQASDVAHTMQHWHVYAKWNRRLFVEMHKAYSDGRSKVDPSSNWYRGEIGFFDFYVIPLAKKLKECGVFGVSSDEYLNYAMANRNEWEEKGQDIVQDYLAEVSRGAVE